MVFGLATRGTVDSHLELQRLIFGTMPGAVDLSGMALT